MISSAWGLLICVLSFRTLAAMPRQNLTSITALMDRSVFLMAGVLLSLPLLSTKLVGILLWVPGLRWLLLWAFKSFQKRKTQSQPASQRGPGPQPFERASRSRGPFVYTYTFKSGASVQGAANSDDDWSEPSIRDVSPIDVPPPKSLNSASHETIEIKSERLSD